MTECGTQPTKLSSIGARGCSHQLSLGSMAGVEDCQIFFLLTHVGHTEILPDKVGQQFRVIWLLRPLDI